MVFALISAFIFMVVAYLIPKRLSYVEMYTAILFSCVFQLIVDILLEFKYGLYGYFDKGVDYRTFVFIFMVYPPLTIIFLNYFPIGKGSVILSMYFLGWVIFAIVYEFFAVQAGAFYYENWKLWYSAVIYPFVYLLISLNFLFIRKLIAQDK
ncbi:CBO0543 family protein [Paucisalibacillus sp. EB02]|uniref:CBO0543 family protein n=1 Tax=Paucisalibacillus sp. EB02 TaxID=1347087 RepID=UPI0006940CC0|nr:CBO0543 family protein [Paucisalibacillus sp. EB02]